MKKTIVRTDEAPAAVGPYSQAIIAGGLLYASGQIALNIPGIPLEKATLAQQVEQVMLNLRAVLRAGGTDFPNVIKATIFLAPDQDFEVVNKIYGRYFTIEPPEKADAPARETVWVHALPKGAKVEISMIALV